MQTAILKGRQTWRQYELPNETALAVRLEASRYLTPCCLDLSVWRGPLGVYRLEFVGPAMTPDEIRAQGKTIVSKETAVELILTELTAQLAELVLEIREIKSDMKRADEQLFGGGKT